MMTVFVKNRRFICFSVLALLVTMVLGFYPSLAEATPPQKPKYIFLFIGDGMGLAHRMAAEYCLAYEAGDAVQKPNRMRLVMDQLPVQSPMTTFSIDDYVTGSGASGTAIACGEKTKNKRLAVLPDGRPLMSIPKLLHQKGYRVGILSSVGINHATPAVFYACIKSRYEYGKIFKQLLDSPFEYFAGGGLTKVKNCYTQMKDRGITVVRSMDALEKCKSGGRIYATNPVLSDRGEALPPAIEKNQNAITLAQFTEQGIRLLDNPTGFFMIIEGGRIDWDAHSNDVGSVVAETIAMDEAVKVAYDFLKKHPKETLIIVTADHETGGLTLGGSGKVKPGIVCKQPYSVGTLRHKIKQVEGRPFEKVLPIITEFYGGAKNLSKKNRTQLEETWAALLAVKNTTDSKKRSRIKKENRLRYGRSTPNFTAECVRLRDKASGIFFAHRGHSSSPVITSVAGVGQELFTGFHDNTDIALNLAKLLDIRLPVIKEKKVK